MTPKVIVKGKVKGKILKSSKPINFLGNVDKKTAIINDERHDLFKKSLSNMILLFPYGIGSSVGAYTIYSIKSNNVAPLAMICTKVDLSVASGCALANIPLVVISQNEFDKLQNNDEIILDTDSHQVIQD